MQANENNGFRKHNGMLLKNKKLKRKKRMFLKKFLNIKSSINLFLKKKKKTVKTKAEKINRFPTIFPKKK